MPALESDDVLWRNWTATGLIGGIGLMSSALTGVFVVLRLAGFIAWSWWQVLAPLWVLWMTTVAVFLVAALLHVAARVLRR